MLKKAIIWGLINGSLHYSLNNEERKIDTLIPILSSLFPGINYYSITGFNTVMNNYGVPVLKKKFPELENVLPEDISGEDTVEITEFLPSKGYEWQDNPQWSEKFKELIES